MKMVSFIFICHNFVFIMLGSLVKANTTCEENQLLLNCTNLNNSLSLSKCCTHDSNNHSLNEYCCVNTDHNNENRLVMLISLSVILFCLSISVVITVCCFWSRCPLFYSCQVNYTHRKIIAYSNEEEALHHPPDENESHEFTPVNMKINEIDEY